MTWFIDTPSKRRLSVKLAGGIAISALLIVGDQGAALAGGDQLVSFEGEAAEVTEAAEPTAAPARADRPDRSA